MIIGNLTIPPLANHIRPAYLIAGGLLVAGVGYLIFTLADSKSGPASVRRFATITLRVTP